MQNSTNEEYRKKNVENMFNKEIRLTNILDIEVFKEWNIEKWKNEMGNSELSKSNITIIP